MYRTPLLPSADGSEPPVYGRRWRHGLHAATIFPLSRLDHSPRVNRRNWVNIDFARRPLYETTHVYETNDSWHMVWKSMDSRSRKSVQRRIVYTGIGVVATHAAQKALDQSTSSCVSLKLHFRWKIYGCKKMRCFKSSTLIELQLTSSGDWFETVDGWISRRIH